MTYRMAMRRRAGFLAALLLWAVAASVVPPAVAPVRAASVTVTAHNYAYLPESRTIAAGDVVHWTFAGDPHSVTSDTGLFDSGVMDPGGSFQFRFTRAGTYHYHCLVHPEQMFGSIVVKAATTPTPTPRPTARPTARPSARPSAGPTARPTPRLTASPTPASSPAAVASPSPSTTVGPSPVTSASVTASQALVESIGPTEAGATPGPGAPAPASASDATPIVLVVVVLGLLGGAALVLARRRRPA